MDRRGNRDEKPTYEQLASVLRYIVNVQKNFPKESKENLLRNIMLQAKPVVKELDKVEAKQFNDVLALSIPSTPVTKWECYDENGLRCKGEVL